MSAEQLLSYLTWTVFVLLFVLVTRTALRRPLWANLNLVAFFAIPTTIIAIGVVAGFGLIQPGPIPNAINSMLLMGIAYVMLRLVDDFSGVPRWLLRASAVVFAVLSVASFVFFPPRPLWVTLSQVLFFFGLQLYAAIAFVRIARQSIGVTRRRMSAVALGSLLLGLAVVASALRAFGPIWQPLFELAALAAGVSYFLGFAPPLGLRRSWQEPELRAFLATTSRLARPSSATIDLRELERSAAATLGTQDARIARWNEQLQQLELLHDGRPLQLTPDSTTATGQAFLEQRPQMHTYRPDRPGVHPVASALQGIVLPRAVLAAPISSGSRRLGTLTIFTQHVPVVVAEDVAVVALLADQIGAMFEARALAEELAKTQAFAEAARLKEDFLSVAAHDLKTPLTTVIGQAQRMERRMRDDPAAAAYLPGVELVSQEAQRLRRIVNELLDAARAERGQLLSEREPVDLVALTRKVAARYDSPRHRCIVSADGPAVGTYDRARVEQLLDHLLDNAVLYSPEGGTIQVTLGRQDDTVALSVRDQGIGIPPEDLPRLFGRFFRGSNVDDRRYTGMGLSLFICRAIVEQHGGRIEASSRLGQGSTFRVKLPLTREQVQHAAA